MSGKLYDNVTADGMKYSIYIPDDCKSDTPILSYNFSAGMKDNNNNYIWRSAKEAVLEQGYDTVVLFPNHYAPYTWNKDYQNNSIAILEDAKEKYGLTSDLFMTTGFSSCSSLSVKTTAEYIRQNPGVQRQIAFAQDGFIWKNGVLNEDELNALIENDTLIVAYCQPENWNKLSNDVIKNLDTLIITDKPEYINYSTNYWGRHDLIARNFFEDGLYNDVLKFLDGKGTLDTSRYNFYITDDNGQKVEVTDPNELYSLLGISSFSLYKSKFAVFKDFILSSSDDDLSNYLNDIRNVINKTSFLNTSFTSFSGSSTTNVPSQIPSLVKKHFDEASKTLNNIMALMDTIAGIHTAYEDTDNKLAALIEKL